MAIQEVFYIDNAVGGGSDSWAYSQDDVAGALTFKVRGEPVVKPFEVVFIKASQAVRKLDDVASEFSITFANSLPPGLPVYNANARLWIQVMRYDDETGTTTIVSAGEVFEIKSSDQETVQLVAHNIFGENYVNRKIITRTCRHVLYGESCGVDRTLYKTPGTILSKKGGFVDIELGEFPPSITPTSEVTLSEWFIGGALEFNYRERVGETGVPTRVGFDHVHGIGANRASFTIEDTSGFYVGDPVVLYPGCRLTLYDCELKFRNVPNHGAFYIPIVDVTTATLET